MKRKFLILTSVVKDVKKKTCEQYEKTTRDTMLQTRNKMAICFAHCLTDPKQIALLAKKNSSDEIIFNGPTAEEITNIVKYLNKTSPGKYTFFVLKKTGISGVTTIMTVTDVFETQNEVREKKEAILEDAA